MDPQVISNSPKESKHDVTDKAGLWHGSQRGRESVQEPASARGGSEGG